MARAGVHKTAVRQVPPRFVDRVGAAQMDWVVLGKAGQVVNTPDLHKAMPPFEREQVAA